MSLFTTIGGRKFALGWTFLVGVFTLAAMDKVSGLEACILAAASQGFTQGSIAWEDRKRQTVATEPPKP